MYEEEKQRLRTEIVVHEAAMLAALRRISEIDWVNSGIGAWLPEHRVTYHHWWSWEDSEFHFELDGEEVDGDSPDYDKVRGCDDYPRHIIEVTLESIGEFDDGSEVIQYRLRQPYDPDVVRIGLEHEK